MFKSRHYTPQDEIERSYEAEKKIKLISYDVEFDEYENALILPVKKCIDIGGTYLSVYEGGVCDESFNFIAGYSRTNNKESTYGSGEVIRSYKTDISEHINENIIYGGVIVFNHFGHLIEDGLVRLWYAAKHKNKNVKWAFNTIGVSELSNFHYEIFKLLGIDESRLHIIRKPTQFKKIVVPKQAWYTNGYAYSRELCRLLWDEITSKITPRTESKIYLSRTKLEKHYIHGETYFEKFFESRGFKVIYPEQLSIEEQIAYIQGADEVALTYGTLAHLAVFAKDETKFIILLRHSKRSLRGNDCFQEYIHAAKNIDFVYIDTTIPIFPSFHASYSGWIIGPTIYWNDFLEKEYGIRNNIDIFEYIDNTNIALGSYIKLYTEQTATQRNYALTYGYKFDHIDYLKQIYMAYAPSIYTKLQRAMKINSNPYFSDKFFIFRSSAGLRCTVKLLSSGRIWPINLASLDNLVFWTFLEDRLYFLDCDYKPTIEFVIETAGRKHNDKVTYHGVAISKVTDSCTLKTYNPGAVRNWVIKHIIKLLVTKRRYKKLKQKPDRFFKDSKNPLIRFMGRYYIRGNSTVLFYWRERFKEYFVTHDMKQKAASLKDGMDDISVKYIENFMRLSKYWYKSTCVGSQWTEYDLKKQSKCREFAKTLVQPFPDILKVKPYFFYDIYGLADLQQEALTSIDGKIIIDGGGLNGDTALVFNRQFPNSEIHVYEPLEHYVNIIKRFLDVDGCNNKIIPVNKGLGDEITKRFIRFEAGANMADITTIDTEYHDNGKPVGLIKLDTEGAESSIIRGAEKTIARDRPVLAIAIYHRPEDFFELKDKIKALNPAYRFMIRKSEPSIPQADLVLIAY